MDNLELSALQIGQKLASAKYDFDHLDNLFGTEGRDPFSIIKEYVTTYPITFEITQMAVDHALNAPVKHQHSMRYHELYDLIAAAHDLLFSSDPTIKCLLQSHKNEDSIAVDPDALPWLLGIIMDLMLMELIFYYQLKLELL